MNRQTGIKSKRFLSRTHHNPMFRGISAIECGALIGLMLVSTAYAAAKSKTASSATTRPRSHSESTTRPANGLPNILIIGDSISMGYMPILKQILAGRANVVHPKANCGSTLVGLKSLDDWLGDTHWTMIQFNWGLHDLAHRNPAATNPGGLDTTKGVVAVLPADYEKNLETLVGRLEKTGAKLVWASTTLVPEGAAGRIVGDDEKYNAIAARVMKRHHIPINDLYAVSKRIPADHFLAPGNVHYKKEGYQKLAEAVVATIEKTLHISAAPASSH